MKLTDRIEYSAASLTDLIHIVVTGDTSQDPAGSSYKLPLSKVVNLLSLNTGDYWTSGSTWNGSNFPIKANNTSGLDAIGSYAVAEGFNTTASGSSSHSEGYQTTAIGNYSHTEGFLTTTIGPESHAEGNQTTASGIDGSHAEGRQTIASGTSSHAEGYLTIAGGSYSHAEGYLTTTLAQSAHAGGSYSIASGATSFVHGSSSVAVGSGTIVLGDNLTGYTPNTVYVNPLVVKNLTTIQRTALTPENGMIIYNTTTNKFQGYASGTTWVDLS